MTLRTQTHLTAIGSGKGGTGKTFVSVCLAQALSHQGERILLFDADMGLANTSVQLGLDESGDVESVLLNGTIGDADVRQVWGGTRARGGFDLLAPPAGCSGYANMDPGTVERLVASLRSARRYDRVILDLAAGVDGAPVAFAAAADETLLVMTPDPAALTDAYAFAKLVLRAGGRVPASVVNMAASEADARRVAESLDRACDTFLKCRPRSAGAIPRDGRVDECIRRQEQLLSLYPQSPAARAIGDIAQRLHARGEPTLALGSGVR
ncbi:MAG: P-loop NTPase [Rhizomicrobium sp.]|jgi:flagellar biosynthesis protein FlhG